MYEQLKLDNQLCFRLYTLARLVTNAYTPFFKQYGITYPQYLVLMVLWEKDNLIVSEITDRIKLETNTVTPLLQRMEKQGLIVRRRCETDTRQRIVSLTPEGKALEESIKDVPTCLAQSIMSKGVTPEEVKTLIPLLDKLTQAIE
ncbi:MAG: MarR family transcriptional regulator [Bacteroidales bacterium]|nr:MarR family transcriptional regulator [Bacteroidales bacterium]